MTNARSSATCSNISLKGQSSGNGAYPGRRSASPGNNWTATAATSHGSAPPWKHSWGSHGKNGISRTTAGHPNPLRDRHPPDQTGTGRNRPHRPKPKWAATHWYDSSYPAPAVNGETRDGTATADEEHPEASRILTFIPDPKTTAIRLPAPPSSVLPTATPPSDDGQPQEPGAGPNPRPIVPAQNRAK